MEVTGAWSCPDLMDASINLIFRQDVLNGKIKGSIEADVKGTCRAEARGETREEKREHRAFTAEFKLEAVQLVRSRRSQLVSLEQIGRELDVGSNQLRAWSPTLEKVLATSVFAMARRRRLNSFRSIARVFIS